MENAEQIKHIIRKEYPYLKNQFGIKRIGLFGSYSTGVANENSDIDLVVEFDKPIGFKFMTLAEYLETKLGRKVDLLTPEGIANIHVKSTAERIKKSIIYV
ncbi:MAG: nucleotidyltransferase [Candidatus Aminicenantes bacterium]|nr:nucleotidyltransferase [Candidatus Aminicenantes bacterium]NIM78883.1 nucleotidyltransferase [Candidatus Aminicenantes bacterium]NIN18139.1 nucleotidyltransferase [Candidatus Aminicenantes bacterium]NIN42038.1 nucleotidyltransferase [Candidatus Aminicenantes bacterium]NIN84794.1 nucleotidyltransferase [Candidatus Aminicenantes bacterium]